MSQTLTRRQSALLGLLVVTALALAAVGLVRIGERQGVWADTFEVAVGFPEAHDIAAGTPVRVRGVEAGQVVGVDYPDHDGADAVVTLRLRLQSRFAGRLYADATAQQYPTGLLGSRVIAVNPGTPDAGPLTGGRLKPVSTPDLTQAAAKIGDAADEAKLLVKDIRTGKGSVGRLVQSDELYTELMGLVADGRRTVKELEGVPDEFRAAVRSLRTNSDALSKMPLIRGYVGDATPLLVRPTWRHDGMSYNAADLFEPDSAILTEGGRHHLDAVAGWLNGISNDATELVVAATCDPANKQLTPATAKVLSEQQAETVVEYLKAQRVHKIRWWWSRRKVTAAGLGFGPSPVAEAKPLPPACVQILLFTPQP